MIKAMLYNNESKALEVGDLELLEAWQADENTTIWLDIYSEEVEIVQPILEQFNIHPLAIEDGLKKRRPPKFEEFDDFLFLLLRGLDAETSGIDFGVIQLGMYVGKRFLITHHYKHSVSTGYTWKLIEDSPALIEQGPLWIGLKISNVLSRRYLEILLDLEPRLEDIETEVFEQPDDSQLSELTRYKSRLRDIGRIGRYHLINIEALRRSSSSLITDELLHDITDTYEQVERTMSLASLYYDTARDLTDGYLALSSHRLNKVMQVLTVITVVFVPLTFIAGIYGMNFENMPELRSTNGYFIVIGVMVSISALLLAIFRRNGWL